MAFHIPNPNAVLPPAPVVAAIAEVPQMLDQVLPAEVIVPPVPVPVLVAPVQVVPPVPVLVAPVQVVPPVPVLVAPVQVVPPVPVLVAPVQVINQDDEVPPAEVPPVLVPAAPILPRHGGFGANRHGPPYRCFSIDLKGNKCVKSFNFLAGYKKHILDVHGNLECVCKCFSKFPSPGDMSDHCITDGCV